MTRYLAALVLLGSGALAAPAEAQPQANSSADPAGQVDYAKDIVPLVKKYCLRCHEGDDAEAGVAMRQYKAAGDFLKNREQAEQIYEALSSELMPPDDEPQPTPEERRRWAKWLDSILFDIDCDTGPDPGRVTIRRLNRNEYNNTIRDLLSLPSTYRPADDFPSDDVGEGFDNIGDVLSLPPLLMEKYMDAAEETARRAILVRNDETAERQSRSGDKLKADNGRRFGEGFAFASAGSVKASFAFRRAGEYLIRVRASGDQAGDEPAKMQWKLNDREIAVVDVPNKRDDPQFFERRIRSRAGRQVLTVTFINDYYKPGKADRNLYIEKLEMVGPVDVSPSELPASHKRLVAVKPRRSSEWVEAAVENLRPIMQRAFRRPLSDAEIAPNARLVLLAQERDESFEEGMRVALASVLVSPQFLFRIERDPNPNDPNASHALTDYELATRLSYFLWSSMPDDELFKLAKQEKLHEPEVLAGQVKRMLRDDRSRALVENFGGQWLNLRNLTEVSRDPQKFRDFDDSLRKAMEQETFLFLEELVRKDRPITDLLTGRFTYVNDDLAKLYGIEGVRGSRFRRVSLEGLPRMGVLTHASILTITSNPTRTSPVMRGKWILENVLGEPPPEPPADVPNLEETQKSTPGASLREQLELHRKSPKCSVCHRKMDELGFGLENFDAIGRWRDRDDGLPVDASGELPGGVSFKGPEELVEVLKGSQEKFARVLAEKMLIYALGRGLQYYDRCAVDEITKRTVAGDYRFSELVIAVVSSDPFLKRRGEGE